MILSQILWEQITTKTNNMHILFTCAGRRNYLINYFKEALTNDDKVFCADIDITAPAMFDADVAVEVPSIYDKNYIDTIIKVIRLHNIDAVISLNDLELPILSKHKNDIESKTNTKVLVSNSEVIDIAFDKMKTVAFLKSIGLKTPKTFTQYNKAVESIQNGEIDYPFVVKPRWGSASIGIDFVENQEELELSYRLQRLKLQKSILKNISQIDIDNALLIQEKINGQEFGMDIVNDFEGHYVGTFVRKKLKMRSGETDKAVSVIDKRFEEIGETISKHLKHVGNLDCDVFEFDNQLYVLELNPRFGGGYPFSHEAGVNVVAMYVNWLKGGENQDQFNKYTSGIITSKCDRMLRM